MPERRYDAAKGDVSKVFADPRDVADAEDLSVPEKVELLRNWELDLREILVASEEGMTRDYPGNASDVLGEVLAALDHIGAIKEDAAAPNKAGST